MLRRLLYDAEGEDSAGPVYEVGAPPEELQAPAFYTKYVSASGRPIVSSERVNDYASGDGLIALMTTNRNAVL